MRRSNRRSNFCLSLAALGPWCGCVTIICLLRALRRTIGNGRLAACRSSGPLPKGAIQAGFASAVRDDRAFARELAALCGPRHYCVVLPVQRDIVGRLGASASRCGAERLSTTEISPTRSYPHVRFDDGFRRESGLVVLTVSFVDPDPQRTFAHLRYVRSRRQQRTLSPTARLLPLQQVRTAPRMPDAPRSLSRCQSWTAWSAAAPRGVRLRIIHRLTTRQLDETCRALVISKL